MATSAAPLRPTMASPVHIEDFAPMHPDPRFPAQEEVGMPDYHHAKRR